LAAPFLTYSQQSAGPFGFEKGMTRDQIIKLVGKDAVDLKASHGGFLKLSTAPKPHSAFESYWLIISPTNGLVKVNASGKTIETGDSGVELRSAFDDVVAGVRQKYGAPLHAYDSCDGGIGCSDSEFWMLSLLQRRKAVPDSVLYSPHLSMFFCKAK
jgi:hypothetical protein